MNSSYFFGNRVGLNKGGRASFNTGGPGFYNEADQKLYEDFQFLPQEQYRLGLGNTTTTKPNDVGQTGIMNQAPSSDTYIPPYQDVGNGGGNGDDDDDGETTNAGITSKTGIAGNLLGFMTNPIGMIIGRGIGNLVDNIKNPYKNAFGGLNKDTRDAIDNQGKESAPGRGDAGNPGGTSGGMTDANAGSFCFDPSTPIQMANGSTKEIKDIQLGDDTKGGEVTGVFQFKATDEIHDYKGVTVAGSHFVKEDGKFIMVKDSPLAIKIDKIPVVYSLDTTGRRIFIKDIEFADYNGDGVAKSFLSNAGVDLSGFDKEVLRQVEHRLI
jgi:hypothetical protein